MTSASHQLLDIRVGDDAQAWTDAGFTVVGHRLTIGGTTLSLSGSDAGRGILSVAIDDVSPGALAGFAVHESEAAPAAATHPNAVVAIDHLVVMTPDCDRTTEELGAAGLEARRVRTFEMGARQQRQTFFWLGDVILELVGEDNAHGDGPASLWGLALTTSDIDATAAHLGDRCSPPKDAVQRGRRITTIKTRDIGVSTALAVLSPHPNRG